MPLKVVIIGAFGHICYAFKTLTAGNEAIHCGIASTSNLYGNYTHDVENQLKNRRQKIRPQDYCV